MLTTGRDFGNLTSLRRSDLCASPRPLLACRASSESDRLSNDLGTIGGGFVMRKTDAERFWEKVDKGGTIPAHRPELGPCWVWTASTNQDGYGRFCDGVRNGTGRSHVIQAHRWLYEQKHGAISAGLEFDHLCRNPPCVRDDHLEPVTHRENQRRGIRGELTTHCRQGHPYNDANTSIRSSGGRTWRTCRICVASNQRRYQQRKRGLSA